jgi:hypothetical protein
MAPRLLAVSAVATALMLEPTSSKAPGHLQWFSFWYVDHTTAGGHAPSGAGSHINFAMAGDFAEFTAGNFATSFRFGRDNVSAFLDVSDVFFLDGNATTPMALHPDYIARWANITAPIRAVYQGRSSDPQPLSSKPVTGFFLGDECCWAGLPVRDQQTAATLIKRDFPDSWMYTNEAFPVFSLGKSRSTSSSGPMHPSECSTKIPPEIDIYSIDAYPDVVRLGPANWPSVGFNGSAQDVRRIYTEKMYPNLRPHQTVLLVPAGYSCSDTQTRASSCGSPTGNCTAVMLEWAQFFWSWAQEDTRVSGIMPWHLHDLGGSQDTGRAFYYGICAMPAVAEYWATVAASILGADGASEADRQPTADICSGYALGQVAHPPSSRP